MKLIGILMVVLALVVGIVPMFTDCESQGRMLTLADGRQISMKCHWTARAELALAVPLAAVGGIELFSKKKESKVILSLLGVVLGILIILLPTALIGVCGNPEMICNMFMKPALILGGSIVSGLSLISLFQSISKKESV